jgi:hypothetical protein
MRFLDYLKRFTYTPNVFYDHLMRLEDAAGGDVKLNILPADPLKVAPGDMDGFVQDVTVQVVNNADEVLTWYNGILNVKAVNGSVSGTIAINEEDPGTAGADVDEDLQFENGILKLKLTYGGTWVDEEDVALTVAGDNKTICGYAVKVEEHDILTVAEE